MISCAYSVAVPYSSESYGSSEEGDTYAIEFAHLEKQFDTMYGMFDFGAFVGYLRSMSTNKDTRTIKFQRRGRNTGEGESSFGNDNIIQLKFLDDNPFEGCAQNDWFDRYEIYGK